MKPRFDLFSDYLVTRPHSEGTTIIARLTGDTEMARKLLLEKSTEFGAEMHLWRRIERTTVETTVRVRKNDD